MQIYFELKVKREEKKKQRRITKRTFITSSLLQLLWE